MVAEKRHVCRPSGMEARMACRGREAHLEEAVRLVEDHVLDAAERELRVQKHVLQPAYTDQP